MSKKPTKPHDVEDVWDMQTNAAKYSEVIDKARGTADFLRKRIEEDNALLVQMIEAESQIKDYLESIYYNNIIFYFMDYDEALDLIIKWHESGKLNQDHFFAVDGWYMFEGEGSFDYALCRKVIRSVGGSNNEKHTDMTIDNPRGLVHVSDIIHEYLEAKKVEIDP